MWEKTVMSDEQIQKLLGGYVNPAFDKKVAKAQAEISYKQGVHDTMKDIFDVRAKERKEGIRKVVEWVEGHIIYIEQDRELSRMYLCGNGYKAADEWQAFKKENGL